MLPQNLHDIFQRGSHGLQLRKLLNVNSAFHMISDVLCMIHIDSCLILMHHEASELDVVLAKVAMVELDGEPCRVRFTDEASGPIDDARWQSHLRSTEVVSLRIVSRHLPTVNVENCV